MKAALAADILRLPDDVTHDVCCWANIVHEGAGLSRVEATVFGITFESGKRGHDRVADDLYRLSGEADAADDGTFSRTLSGWRATGVLPLRHHPIAQHPVGCTGPADVEESGEHRVLGAASRDQLLVHRARCSLVASKKARAHRYGLRAEGESGNEPAAIGDSSCGDHRNRSHCVDDGGEHYRERGGTEYMSTGLHTLCDHGVHTALRGGQSLRNRCELGNNLNAAAVGVGDEGPGISSEQAEDRKPGVEAGSELVALQDCDDEVGEKWFAGERARAPNLFGDKRRWQASQAKRAEAARIRHRCG